MTEPVTLNERQRRIQNYLENEVDFAHVTKISGDLKIPNKTLVKDLKLLTDNQLVVSFVLSDKLRGIPKYYVSTRRDHFSKFLTYGDNWKFLFNIWLNKEFKSEKFKEFVIEYFQGKNPMERITPKDLSKMLNRMKMLIQRTVKKLR